MANKGKRKHTDSAVKKRRWSLVAIAAIIVCAIAVAFPPNEKINQGLDIQGGLSVVLSASTDDGSAVSSEDLEASREIIESRVNALGASEASVQIQGDDQILVQIPGLTDSAEALETIGRTGKLEFARLDSFTDSDVQSSIESGSIYDTSSAQSAYESETGATFSLTNYDDLDHITVEEGTYEALFTGDHITNVSVSQTETGTEYSVNLTLDEEATQIFAEATEELAADNGQIVIILDGEVNSAPAVESAITGGEVAITGNYTLEEAQSLKTVLESGSLPVSFTYEQAQTVGPTLGQGELEAGLLAMLIGLIVVVAYLLCFYRGYGILTAANMLVFAIVYIGVLATLSALGVFSLSLAGIAGIILSIGMAADSSILVIERFKEEMKEGRSTKAASISGVKHAITTSIDADVVSLISAFALFAFASSSVKGFGLTLGIGILCDILVMLMFKAPLVRLLAPKVMKYSPNFWGIKYALELGDVRCDTSNYMTPQEVKTAREEEKEDKKQRKQHDKEAAEKQKERKKLSDAKAKEIKKERAAREKELEKKQKEQEKEKKKREKEAEKRRRQEHDEAIIAKRKAIKEAEKLDKEKLDDKDDEETKDEVVSAEETAKESTVDEETKESTKQEKDNKENADETAESGSSSETTKSNEKPSDGKENADETDADDASESVSESTREPQNSILDEENGEENKEKKTENTTSESKLVEATIVEETVEDTTVETEEKEEKHSNIEAHSSDEIDAFIEQAMSGNAPLPKQNRGDEPIDNGDGNDYVTSGPSGEFQYSAGNSMSGAAPDAGTVNRQQPQQPKMNRQQRRAAERAAKKRGNNNDGKVN